VTFRNDLGILNRYGKSSIIHCCDTQSRYYSWTGAGQIRKIWQGQTESEPRSGVRERLSAYWTTRDLYDTRAGLQPLLVRHNFTAFHSDPTCKGVRQHQQNRPSLCCCVRQKDHIKTLRNNHHRHTPSVTEAHSAHRSSQHSQCHSYIRTVLLMHIYHSDRGTQI